MSHDAQNAAIEHALAILSEHFDTVQILASHYTPLGDPDGHGGTTHHFYRGQGNWFARTGMAEHFISMDRAGDQARALAPAIRPSNGD